MNFLQSSDRRMKAVKENSIISFNSAANYPIDFIEFDVQVGIYYLFFPHCVFNVFLSVSFFFGGFSGEYFVPCAACNICFFLSIHCSKPKSPKINKLFSVIITTNLKKKRKKSSPFFLLSRVQYPHGVRLYLPRRIVRRKQIFFHTQVSNSRPLLKKRAVSSYSLVVKVRLFISPFE